MVLLVKGYSNFYECDDFAYRLSCIMKGLRSRFLFDRMYIHALNVKTIAQEDQESDI